MSPATLNPPGRWRVFSLRDYGFLNGQRWEWVVLGRHGSVWVQHGTPVGSWRAAMEMIRKRLEKEAGNG